MEKRQEIELLRIVSAFGVVWFHTSTIGKDFALSGLIVFLILSMYFSARPGSRPKPLIEKAKRILIPWSLWFIFYGMINLMVNKPFIPLENGLVAGVLAGTKIHLWYMPFIFIMVALFTPLNHLNDKAMAYLCVFCIVFIFTTTKFWIPPAVKGGEPWWQYAHALAGVFIGVFFAKCNAIPRLISVALVFLIAVFALSTIGIAYFVGITATALVLLPRWSFNFKINVNAVSECTLGIYLLHPFWIGSFKKLGFSSDLGLPFLVSGLSLFTVWCLKRMMPNLSKYTV